jgi:hypothetical protein
MLDIPVLKSAVSCIMEVQMPVKPDGSEYGMPLKRAGRRGRVTRSGTVSGVRNDDSRNTGQDSGISKSVPEDVPVEIRAEDSVSYVRLLNDVAWVNDVSDEIARHYPPGKVVWSLDRKRLSVVAEMQRRTEESGASRTSEVEELPRDSVLEIESSAPAREDSVETRKVLQLDAPGELNGYPLPWAGMPTMDWHPEKANHIPLPPVAARRKIQPSPTIHGIRKNAGYYSVVTSEIPLVRSSVPPPVGRQRRNAIGSWAMMASLVAVFAAAVLIMLSTPFPLKGSGEAQHGVDQIGGPIKGATEFASLVPVKALSEPGRLILPLSSAVAGEVTMFFTLEEVEAAIASGIVPAYGDPDSPEVLTTPETDSRKVRKARWAEYRKRHPRARRYAAVNNRAAVSRSAARSEEESPKPVPAVAPVASVEEAEITPYAAPAVPSPQSVRHAMSRISRQVSRCRMGMTGQMVMRMSFAGSNGRLVSAEIINADFRGTPSGSCALRAVQHLQLPAFQQNQLVIVYPFYL